VRDCIEVACYAPNASNAQEWRWVVIDEPELRGAVATQYRAVTVPPVTQMLATKEAKGDDAGARISRSILWLAEHLHEVPVLVIPCYDVAAAEARYRDLIPDDAVREAAGGVQTREMTSGMYASILPAVWSFQLALRSRGLGSAFTTLHLMEEAAAAELLGIPETVTQCALIPVAYTIGDEFKPASRKPIRDVVYANSWRQRVSQ
jgi:nitroreductase